MELIKKRARFPFLYQQPVASASCEPTRPRRASVRPHWRGSRRSSPPSCEKRRENDRSVSIARWEGMNGEVGMDRGGGGGTHRLSSISSLSSSSSLRVSSAPSPVRTFQMTLQIIANQMQMSTQMNVKKTTKKRHMLRVKCWWRRNETGRRSVGKLRAKPQKIATRAAGRRRGDARSRRVQYRPTRACRQASTSPRPRKCPQ